MLKRSNHLYYRVFRYQRNILYFFMFLLLELEWALLPYPLNNGYLYQSKNGQTIHQNTEDNNIRFNNKNNNKGHRKFISNYENQRHYTKEFLESLYAN